jgi:hypothetical protein
MKVIDLLVEHMEGGFLDRREFYDYDAMRKNWNHSKVLKVLGLVLERLGYEWLTEVRINQTTAADRVQNGGNTRYVADLIGYHNHDPKEFSVIVEYESIDSARYENENRELKISRYIDRLFQLRKVTLSVMIAVFTTTNTKIWGIPRERKELHPEILKHINESKNRLPEGSEFAFISIFDDRITGQIFNKDGEEQRKQVSRRIQIHP